MILHVSDSGLSFLRFTSLPSPVYGLSPSGYNNERFFMSFYRGAKSNRRMYTIKQKRRVR